MRKPLLVIVALVFACTGSWAARDPAGSPAALTPASPPEGCGEEPPCSIAHVFSPGNNSFVYDFSALDGSTLRVDFVGGVISTFSLTVTDATLTDAQLTARLDPRVFQAGTSCFHYFDSLCHEYAFTGNAGGPNGVPVLRVDYNRPGIKLKLTYFSPDPVHNPAFAHAPGESTTFSEDILADYAPSVEDDTMCSDAIPGLSNLAALSEPLEENDTYCWVSPSMNGQAFKVGDEVEVAFRLFASGSCPVGTGTPIRDRDALVSLGKVVGGELVFQEVRIKKFHFDHKEGVNRTEIDTEELTPGTYFITVRSDEFSPQTRQFNLVP